MNNNLDVITEIRRSREALASVLKDHAGIRNLVEELYPDSAHFIFELLQNAEDTGAKKCLFRLYKNQLTFEHDGRPFRKNDIEAITDIGAGTKSEDDEKIGKFGIGFKAVFAYSETPHIWSQTYSFKLERLVLPFSIADRVPESEKTLFKFPFNNPKKPAKQAFLEIKKGLTELSDRTLLFLRNIQMLELQSEDGPTVRIERVSHSTNHVEIITYQSGTKFLSMHYLKFVNEVRNLTSQNVAIAFPLDFLKESSFDNSKELHEQMRIVPAKPGSVSVFFPADKEVSGLRFHVHGPFIPEVSRASIKETPLNDPLFDQLSELAIECLYSLKKLQFLNVQTLAVFPNSHDSIALNYQKIREAIILEMNQKNLTPSRYSGHRPAKSLVNSRASFKNILEDNDLPFWLHDEDFSEGPYWSMSAAQRHSNSDRFLSDLQIKYLDFHSFIEKIKYFADYDDDDYDKLEEWLNGKPVEWFHKFYAFLYDELGNEENFDELEDSRIIKLEGSGYSKPKDCFFKREGFSRKNINWVDPEIFTDGKSKKEKRAKAQKFLQEVGVKEIGEEEEIVFLLDERYKDITEPIDIFINTQDLKIFAEYLERNSSFAIKLKEYEIFICSNGKMKLAKNIFIDTPFKKTGVSSYFDELLMPKTYSLSDKYENVINDFDIVSLAKELGANFKIPILKKSCRHNPNAESLYHAGYGSRTNREIDKDYAILDLKRLMNKPNLNLSKSIWQSICKADVSWWEAQYRRNYNDGMKTNLSHLGYLLKLAKWVPQEGGMFVIPAEASAEKMPGGFEFDKDWPWLEAIHFGRKDRESARNIEVEKRQDKEYEINAQKLGFLDKETAEVAKELSGHFSIDEMRYLMEQRKEERQVTPFEMPDSEPKNPERRAKKVTEKSRDADSKETEKRSRSVSISGGVAKQEARQYLQQQYTNDDGVMACQICQRPMPFKLENGDYYFEAVEFVKGLVRHLSQNHLALCPNHAAMYHHANGSKEIMSDLFFQMEEQVLSLNLANKEKQIYFTKTHSQDLSAVLKADEND
jgi:hypothetical protein